VCWLTFIVLLCVQVSADESSSKRRHLSNDQSGNSNAKKHASPRLRLPSRLLPVLLNAEMDGAELDTVLQRARTVSSPNNSVTIGSDDMFDMPKFPIEQREMKLQAIAKHMQK